MSGLYKRPRVYCSHVGAHLYLSAFLSTISTMRFSLCALLACGLAAVRADWPDGPLVTSGRWIHNAKGGNVTYVGINWPGAADVMIPEGLQYTSIAKIVSDIRSLGMNAIRLTFAIEMIDDIIDNGGDKTIQAAFTKALGATNGPTIYQKVLANNPTFSASTTRVQVYDAIAAECFKQQIYVHLDNHMSKGGWCCSTNDVSGEIDAGKPVDHA